MAAAFAAKPNSLEAAPGAAVFSDRGRNLSAVADSTAPLASTEDNNSD